MNDRRSVLQESLAAIQRLQARLATVEAARHEPIAIIGMACRFPGGVETPEAYWELLRNGTDAVAEVPPERWDAEAFYSADPKAAGKMITKRGGFLRQVDQFDPGFFGISPREALTLDPQQRLLLETTTEALERAGIATDSLAGSRTGVFVGITTSDYRQVVGSGPDRSDVYSATGSALNAAAGRIAFTFGLQGPCMALDTACSSSLVAVHLACQSLRSGESRLALAAGVNVVLSPEAMVLFSKWGMMAPDGKCKTFDAAADGFVRAEGCAALALKRLSDALADGDPVLAVIRGSATNSDGRSSGLTVPNGPAQEAVLRSALADAQLQAADIDYVEAHGTGTPLGDPIEVEALAHVMGAGRETTQPLRIGSAKTNLGHTEAASGLAGLMKVVLSLQHEHLAPHLHLRERNPRIDWASAPLEVPTVLTPWPRGARVRRAGVSSFGFSGTNAHVVLEEAPAAASTHTPAQPVASETKTSLLFALSGHTDAALRAHAARLAAWLRATPALHPTDVARTLAEGRAHARHRVAFVASEREELLRALDEVARGGTPPAAASGQLRTNERARIAFVFTGQGSQYVGMGRGLYESEPVFRAVIDEAQTLLAGTLERPLTEVMFGEHAALLHHTAYTQPALFALEVALARLLQSWGIVPAVVVGHSVGEYAAACVAGVFGFAEGLALIAERGRLMQALPAGGAMVALACAPERVAPLVARTPQALAIAAVNAPEETVLSGSAEAVAAAAAELAALGVKSQALTVSHAFHSPLLAPMLDAFERRAAAVAAAAPDLTLIANVTGEPFAPGTAPDAAYWRAHARGTVHFAAGVRSLKACGATVLVEIGPHPTLLGLASRCEPGASWAMVPTLRRPGAGPAEDARQLRLALAQLHVRGAAVNWGAVSFGPGARRVALPTTAFQRERHWAGADGLAGDVRLPADESPRSTLGHQRQDHAEGRAGGRAAAPAGTHHPLLGEHRDLAAPVAARVWEQEFSLEAQPWLTDHRVQGAAIVPATAYIEMALAAARQTRGDGPLAVRSIENLKPMILREGDRRLVQATLLLDGKAASDTAALRFTVHSREVPHAIGLAPAADDWTAHMSAEVSVERPRETAGATSAASAADASTGGLAGALPEASARAEAAASLPPAAREALLARCANASTGSEFYAALARQGNQWGPCFQGLAQVWHTGGEALARIEVPAPLAADMGRYLFHPAVSDACGHALVATVPRGESAADGNRTGAFVGAGVGEVRFHRAPRGRTLWSHARLKPGGSDDAARRGIVLGDVLVYDEDGVLVGETRDARLWYLDAQAGAELVGAPADWFYAVRWQARPHAMGAAPVAGTPMPAGPSRAAAPGTWLILADQGGVAEAMAAQRAARGERTVLARPGASLAVDGDRATVRFDMAGDFEALLRQSGPLAAVLHLGLLDAALPTVAGTTGADSIQADWLDALASGPQATVHLLHALRGLPSAPGLARPRLWLVTRGAQTVNGADATPAPLAAMLWGLGRTLAAEHAELWGGLIDLEHGAAAHAPNEPSASIDPTAASSTGGTVPNNTTTAASAAADTLLREVRGEFADGEDRIAWRAGQRYVARLARRGGSPRHRQGRPVLDGGTVIVTGGLGGIGLAMAEWLVQHGTRHLVLIGRQGLPARAEWDGIAPTSREGKRIATLRAMEAAGATVAVAALDVADGPALRRLLEARRATGAPPARGVIHAAGVLQFDALAMQTAAGLQPLLAAKVGGAWHLHQLLASEPLDFFVMCSSTSALLASPLLGGYAAGNAFLDALAHHRRASGRAALSINWGTWGEVGMAANAAAVGTAPGAMLHGVATMDTARALAAMDTLLSGGDVQGAVMPVDWGALAAAYSGFAADPFFADLTGPALAMRTGSSGAAASASLPTSSAAEAERLRSADAAEQPGLLAPYLREHAARVLGMAAHKLDTATPLATLGFDSLMAVQLKNAIEAELGVVVPMIQFLQGPSIEELVPGVLEALAASQAQGRAASAATGPDSAAARQSGASAAPRGGAATVQEDWEEGSL